MYELCITLDLEQFSITNLDRRSPLSPNSDLKERVAKNGHVTSVCVTRKLRIYLKETTNLIFLAFRCLPQTLIHFKCR